MVYKHYIIYETTNTINGKFYRGLHCTDDLDDGYLGSGKIFKQAIAKYGKETFTRKILCYGDSVEELQELEELAVTQEEVDNPNCYNMLIGGQPPSFLGRTHTEETKRKCSINNGSKKPEVRLKLKITNGGKNNGMYSKKHTDVMSPEVIRMRAEKISKYHKGKQKTEEHCRHISEAKKGKLTGDYNPNFKTLTQTDKDLITQFKDWKDKNPQTISLRLKKLGTPVGASRIKRLQDSEDF